MSAPGDKADAAETRTTRQHCLEILTSGYPQAFKEFFELTHIPTTEASEGRGTYGEAQLLPSISLVLLRGYLVAAEAAARKGEMGSVYLAYRELAEHFEASEQEPPAIEYYRKCLEIARDANHRGLQMEAYERLGCAHERHVDLLQSIAFFEKQAALAQSGPDIQRATTHLREVYWKRAEQLEREKDYPGAIADYQEVVAAAQTLGDVRWEGQACYRLGLVFTRTGDPTTALPHLHKYRDICQHDGDRVGEGQACCALAEAYQAVGDTGEALAHLEAFLAVANTAEPALQARACCSLGVIYGQQGDLERALAYFEQFFALATTTADRAMIDAARTHLGRARARMNMGTFMSTVESADGNAQSLLGWKLDRLPLQMAAQSG